MAGPVVGRGLAAQPGLCPLPRSELLVSAIHAAFRMGINGYPFLRAIHFCCAHRIGSKARFDQQIAPDCRNPVLISHFHRRLAAASRRNRRH